MLLSILLGFISLCSFFFGIAVACATIVACRDRLDPPRYLANGLCVAMVFCGVGLALAYLVKVL
jgi:hypothetical protein